MTKNCTNCHYSRVSSDEEPCVYCTGFNRWQQPRTDEENELTSPNTVCCPHSAGKLKLSGGEPR